jgi:hypothetical protein
VAGVVPPTVGGGGGERDLIYGSRLLELIFPPTLEEGSRGSRCDPMEGGGPTGQRGDIDIVEPWMG